MDRHHPIRVILIFAFSLFILGLAHADRVIPSERVSSHLNVRAGPGTDNPVISTLDNNDSAELLDEVPYWYHVRLETGSEGFVSKAWSKVVTGTAATGRLLRLGAWNIKHLGYDNDKDFATVARIIEDHFDILAVVEVMQKQHARPGYDELMATLGEGWAGMVTATPRPNRGSGYSEFYAVVYRTDLIRPCAGWAELRYHIDNDGSDTGQGADHFSREPAYGCFAAPASSHQVGVDFLLGVFHARWGGGRTSEIAEEVGHLYDVFTAMAAARPGERDLWIVGDFNLVPADLATIFPHGDRTEGTGSTLHDGHRTDHLYDHVLVHDELASTELVGNAAVLDVRDTVATSKVFYDMVSDHLPIVITVRTGGPDDD